MDSPVQSLLIALGLNYVHLERQCSNKRMEISFDFNEEKNQLLYEQRGITFQDIIATILKQGILADFPHPNSKKYPNQRILVVELKSYTYCIPYVKDENVIFLKTIFPSRKLMYLLEQQQ